LKKISKNIPPFEITVGMNGRIWLKATSVKQTIFLVDAINKYAEINDSQAEVFIENLLKNYDQYLEEK
jgi:exosome complex RNA-binding protein Rrp4